MNNLYAQETWVEKDGEERHCIIDESPVYETFTDDPGRLFREFQKEYGKCVSKVYVDLKDGTTKHIGWVFEKTSYYEDTREPFTLETWVSLHKCEPTHTVEHHYADL